MISVYAQMKCICDSSPYEIISMSQLSSLFLWSLFSSQSRSSSNFQVINVYYLCYNFSNCVQADIFTKYLKLK